MKIKKLDWKRFGDTCRIAKTSFGNYCIWATYNGAVSYSIFDREKIAHENILAAEKSCQADFETKIKESLAI